MNQKVSDDFPRRVVSRLMWLSHKQRQRVCQRMEEIGIGGGAGPILMTLGAQGEMNQKELAQKIHVSAATVSQTLKPLVKEGLVERKSDENDARVFLLRLTEEGLRKREQAMAIFAQMDSDLLMALTDEEQDQLAALLQKLEGRLKGENQ